jgi:hypothetical protein
MNKKYQGHQQSFFYLIATVGLLLIGSGAAYGYGNTGGIERAPEYGFGDRTISILDGRKANPLGSGRAVTLGYSAALGHHDNVDYSPSAPEKAKYVSFAPYAGVSKVHGDHQFWLNARAKVAAFDTSNSDDYADLSLQTAAMFNTSGKHRFEVDGRYLRGHHQNAVQRTRPAGVANESLDRYAQAGVSLRYILGQPQARLRFALLGGVSDREYRNNRYATQFYDHKKNNVGFQALYQLATKTTLVTGLGLAETEFDATEAGFAKRDSETSSFFAGLRWLATAKTAGEVRVGYRATDFDSNSYSDEDRVYWNVLVDWRPTLRDKLALSTSRSQDVSRFSNVADVERTQYTVRWVRGWRGKYQTNLGVDYIDVLYQGEVGSAARSDDVIRYVAGVKTKLGQKSTIGIGYVRSERNGDSSQFDYDADTLELTLEANL